MKTLALIIFSVAVLYNVHHNSLMVNDGVLAARETNSNLPPVSVAYTHNNTNLPLSTKCTQTQKDEIFKQLGRGEDYAWKNNQLGTSITSKTKCPVPTWIERFYEEESDIGSGSFLGISVGCNKGHDAIRTARMGFASDLFDAQKWRAVVSDKVKAGICNQEEGGQAKINDSHEKRKGEMHCIEPLPKTAALLKNATKRLGLGSLVELGMAFMVTHAAISSRDGTTQFPGESEAGKEDLGMDTCNSGGGGSCVDVPMYSLESYVKKFVKGTGPVNILQIDVEGFDFDVLFGAGSVLDRTHYLEFEYHVDGNWASLHLQDAVKLLDGKGFTCYWQGVDKLWRITSCYIDEWDRWHGWSNVACVHRTQANLAARMEKLFLSTIE